MKKKRKMTAKVSQTNPTMRDKNMFTNVDFF